MSARIFDSASPRPLDISTASAINPHVPGLLPAMRLRASHCRRRQASLPPLRGNFNGSSANQEAPNENRDVLVLRGARVPFSIGRDLRRQTSSVVRHSCQTHGIQAPDAGILEVCSLPALILSGYRCSHVLWAVAGSGSKILQSLFALFGFFLGLVVSLLFLVFKETCCLDG